MNNLNNERVRLMQLEKNYSGYRSYALMVFIFSLINVIGTATNSFYFLFSSYISLQCAAIGSVLTAETGDSLYLIVMAVVAVITAIPYLLCWIFSKKKSGWMIAAAIIFGIDTVMLLLDTIPYGLATEWIMDYVFHALCLVMLLNGVKTFKQLKAARAAYALMETEAANEAGAENGEAYTAENTGTGFTRRITITRKKQFVGCAVTYEVYIDGAPAAQLKSGATVTLTLSDAAHNLMIAVPNGSSPNVEIPAGTSSHSYLASGKMTMNGLAITVAEV